MPPPLNREGRGDDKGLTLCNPKKVLESEDGDVREGGVGLVEPLAGDNDDGKGRIEPEGLVRLLYLFLKIDGVPIPIPIPIPIPLPLLGEKEEEDGAVDDPPTVGGE